MLNIVFYVSFFSIYFCYYYYFLVYWIALLQAILGGAIQVPTLTGDVVLKVCLKFVYD